MLPALSRTRTFTEKSPIPRLAVGWTTYTPVDAEATVEAITFPEGVRIRSTVAPGATVPVILGLRTDVRPSPRTLVSSACRIVGADGVAGRVARTVIRNAAPRGP